MRSRAHRNKVRRVRPTGTERQHTVASHPITCEAQQAEPGNIFEETENWRTERGRQVCCQPNDCRRQKGGERGSPSSGRLGKSERLVRYIKPALLEKSAAIGARPGFLVAACEAGTGREADYNLARFRRLRVEISLGLR